MRFGNDDDYAIFINAIRDLGLPVNSQIPKTKIPLLPSPAPSSFMSSSPALPMNSLQSLQARPFSASSNAPDDMFSSRAKLPPHAEFKVPERPGTSESLQQRPSSTLSRPVSSQSGSGALNLFANSVSLSNASQPRTTSFREPTRQLYLSQLEREVQELCSHLCSSRH